MKAAQREPNKNNADEHPEPELPFFHEKDCNMPKTCNLSRAPTVSRSSWDNSLDIISRVDLHRPAANFELPDLQGRFHRLSDYRGDIVILNFWSAECPHSERTDRYLTDLAEKRNGDVVLLSIAPNRNESIQMLEEASTTRHLPIVLIDAELVVADLYEAQTTPHAFVIDKEGILRYRGAVDDVTFRQRKASRFFLEETVEALLNGRLPELAEMPAYGCTIVREI